MWVLKLVVVSCYLASSALASPQLFPFTNLKKYFDHQARHGPNPPAVDTRDLQPEPTRFQPTVLPATPVQYPVEELRPPGVAAPAFSYAPYLTAPATPEDGFVDILKESPKPPRATPTLHPQPQVFGAGLDTNPPPNTASFLVDAFKPKPTSSSALGDLYKTKPNTLSNNKYPKKYQSELVGYNGDGASDLYAKKKNHSPKKEQSLYKEQKYQTNEQVAKTITAANFQKEPKLGEATLAYRKPYYPQPIEQQAAESGFHGISSGADGGFGGGFGGGAGDVGGFGGGHHLGGGERVEFQMHGHHGPNSYKFGYDTGKGHNRQFRFEERDAQGHVKGHYGFYDKSGKLRMVNYHADHHGFHADGNLGNHANR